MPKVSTVLGPTRLIAKLGGFCGPKHEVRWQGGKLLYRTDGLEAEVAPSAAEWKAFWVAIDRAGVFRWQANYDDPDILDGTHWSLDLSDGWRGVRSFGSNAYPGGKDLEHALPFQGFLNAVGALLQHPFGRSVPRSSA